MGCEYAATVVDSPLGPVKLAATEHGLLRIGLPRHAGRGFAGWIERTLPQATRVDWMPVLDKARIELEEYFRGARRAFDVTLDLRGTDFQLRVWRALVDVPFGETRTYGELARGIGRDGAQRAVGAANGANPLPIVVPCHRIVAARGKLGGYTGGLGVKRRLLAHEKGLSATLI